MLGQGEPVTVREALARVEIGTAIGQLPRGVSQTSIQADFDRELERLKLEKYRTGVQQELDLDLRENRRVKSEEAAFLDLHRSSFFHRLHVLGVSFAQPAPTRQQSATWAEKWLLQWTPESEIQLVEAVLLGETVELATAYKFKSQLEACTSIADAAALVRHACQCGLMKSMDPRAPAPAGAGRDEQRVHRPGRRGLAAEPGRPLRRRPPLRPPAAPAAA